MIAFSCCITAYQTLNFESFQVYSPHLVREKSVQICKASYPAYPIRSTCCVIGSTSIFSTYFFPVTNVLNIMGIPYAWFLTLHVFKLHIHVANRMKYLCGRAKRFTVHIYCWRNQTINQKFQGTKTIWDKHSIQLNGMHLFQRATPQWSALHRE